jgi:hypothetical protein
MAHNEVFGRVDFSVSCGFVPWGDPYEYVHTVTGKIVAYSDTDAEIEAGEIVMRVVSTTEVTNTGESLYHVCDADSTELEGIYAALFDSDGETKEELDIEPGWNNLVFLEGVKIDPEFQRTGLVIHAIETAIAMFASEGLVVAIEERLELSVDEWKQLGFVRAAGTGLVFRDQLTKNPYRDEKSS